MRAGVLSGSCLLAFSAACDDGSDPPPIVDDLALTVDAATVTGTLAPLWRDHYDLSWQHFAYAAEPGFSGLTLELEPRSWRCSIGRWEVGFPPPAGADSLDPAELMASEREYYRGPNTLAGADDPANYDFAYLDALLSGLIAVGAEPFLCFEMMPFALSSEQDPLNAANFNVTQPGVPYSQYSYSNGIRTAPPADPAVYARVVRNAVRHVRGLFAGTTDYGIEYVEIGNEPDLVDELGQPIEFFWTGSRTEWIEMYAAIAAEIDADPQLSGLVRLGGGSFGFQAFEPAPTFIGDFLAGVAANGTRLDFLSFHTYGDAWEQHLERLVVLDALLTATGLDPDLVNAEWGRALDGLDPVYDQIEHGLFRARVIGLMQVFGVSIAHEALFRNPGFGSGELGLVRTGPPAHKPVSRCYQALGRLDVSLEAVEVTADPGLFALAGRDAAGTRVTVVVVAEEPEPGHETRLVLDLTGLPFGPAGYEVRVSKVDEATTAGGQGVLLLSTTAEDGPSHTQEVLWGPGQAGLFVFELVAL